MARGPMQLHRLHRLKAGPVREVDGSVVSITFDAWRFSSQLHCGEKLV